jgi:hypothetical protein
MKAGIVFLLLMLSGPLVQPLFADEPLDVSIVQLIANPKDYDGKVVRVIGFVKLDFEGDAVYLHKEDYKHGVSKNGLWIQVTDEIRKDRKKFDEKYVLVEGIFNARDTGHMGLFSGSIQKISRFEVWR